jgi:hypothetical protein
VGEDVPANRARQKHDQNLKKRDVDRSVHRAGFAVARTDTRTDCPLCARYASAERQI